MDPQNPHGDERYQRADPFADCVEAAFLSTRSTSGDLLSQVAYFAKKLDRCGSLCELSVAQPL
jgi:hypothetical protein